MPDMPAPAALAPPGHLATPAGAGPWPGVVVVHEAFGLTDDVRRATERIAEQGYLAFAPDLFSWGSTPRCLVATMRALTTGSGRALDDIDAARRHLLGHEDCTGRVGVIGFCMGGGFALLAVNTGFHAAAPNYGEVPKNPESALRGACPVVASYGGRDRMLKGRAPRLEAALSALAVEHDVKEYESATHGFLFPHTGRTGTLARVFGVTYDAAAADDAWARIFSFFDRHLRKGSA